MIDIVDELRQTAGNLISGVIEDGEVSTTMLAEAAIRIEALEAALREAERFVAYLANETDGHFVGSGTPTTCLVMIRAALAPEQDK